MEKKKKKKSSGDFRVTGFLLGAAAVLLLGSAVGSSQAALTYYSENYTTQFEVDSIGVTLRENGEDVSWRNYNEKNDEWSTNRNIVAGTVEDLWGPLLGHMLDTENGEKLQPGKAYEERLSVYNSGAIDEYVRVSINRYWLDGERKDTSVSPELIDLNLTGNGWVKDEKASTAERTVLYYTRILPAGEQSTDLSDTLTIDREVAEHVTVTEKGDNVIETVYEYDGLNFVLEAEVDAVQTHNAVDAIKSAWGVDVAVGADGSLSLR